MKFSTKAIHIGNEPHVKEGGSGDVVIPIHLSTTFAREKVNEPTAGLEYSRSGNPTRFALERNLAALENGKYAFAYASGLAAITNILLLLKSGDHILSIDADIVNHSMTKYIGGHSDSVEGSVIVNNDAIAERLKFLQNAVGAILSPFDSYQILKGSKTLGIRMQQQTANAKKIVEFLKS